MQSRPPPRSTPPPAIDSLRRLVRALRTASHHAEGALGVSGAQLFVLQQLAESPAASLAMLAARTQTDASSVSVVTARLVSRGLVARRASALDARRAELTLTAAGRRVLARAPVPIQAKLIAALDELPAQRRTQLARTLAEVVARLGLAGGPVEMFFEEDATAPAGSSRRRAGGRRA